MDEESKKHTDNLGRLVGNMHSLEFILRAFLLNSEIQEKRQKGLSHLPVEFSKLKQGDIIPENAFTNYDNLGELIRKYNNHTLISSTDLTIDETLVYIRDAIAHGRVSSDNPSGPLQLLKFERPKNNKVEVIFSVLMTEGWFKEQIIRFHDAIVKINKANERLQNGGC
jgi:hypothetical protein